MAYPQAVRPDTGLGDGIVPALAFGVAEFRLRAGAPGLEADGLLVLLHEVIEPDAGARQGLGLVQGGPEEFFQRESRPLVRQAGRGFLDGLGTAEDRYIPIGDEDELVVQGHGRDAEPDHLAIRPEQPQFLFIDAALVPERPGAWEIRVPHWPAVGPNQRPVRVLDDRALRIRRGQPQQAAGFGVGPEDSALATL